MSIEEIAAADANSKFLTWLAGQADDVRSAVLAQWDQTAAQDDIVDDGTPVLRNHARLSRTMQFAAEQHGYDWTV